MISISRRFLNYNFWQKTNKILFIKQENFAKKVKQPTFVEKNLSKYKDLNFGNEPGLNFTKAKVTLAKNELEEVDKLTNEMIKSQFNKKRKRIKNNFFLKLIYLLLFFIKNEFNE